MPRTAYTPKIKPTHKHAQRRAECEQRILELLAAGPMSNHDLGEALGLSRSGVRRYTDSMNADRTIHISAYSYPSNGPARPLFSAGDKPDAPLILRKAARVSHEERRTRIHQKLMAALAKGGNILQISTHMEMSKSTSQNLINALRKEPGNQVRIASWMRAPCGRQWMPAYAIGTEPDAPRQRSDTERARKRDPSARKGDDQLSLEARRALVQGTIASAKAKPHNIFAALGI